MKNEGPYDTYKRMLKMKSEKKHGSEGRRKLR